MRPEAGEALLACAALMVLAIARAHRRRSRDPKCGAEEDPKQTREELGIVISTKKAWEAAAASKLEGAVVVGVDVRGVDLAGVSLCNALLLGCNVGARQFAELAAMNALLLPKFPESLALPFDPYRYMLYSAEELYQGLDPLRSDSAYEECTDAAIYRYFLARSGAKTRVIDRLAMNLHDFSIGQALQRAVAPLGKVTAIMGGHDCARGSAVYLQAMKIARALTLAGFTIVTGGGPGAMEAANLGALTAHESLEAVESLLAQMKIAPDFKHPKWISSALLAKSSLHARPGISIGVPTFFYGHEPSNVFPTFIAKYFDNSQREASILDLATGGAVFFPGSAGTLEEIFAELCRNHYSNDPRPMVFMDEAFWSASKVLPAIAALSRGKEYAEMIQLINDEEVAVRTLKRFAGLALSGDAL